MTDKLLRIIVPVLICLLLVTGCKSKEDQSEEKEIAEIQRGDLLVSVVSDGTLVMPRVFDLQFGTTGTVKEVMVEEGDEVKAGTLLAKLDDTTQVLAIEKALYDLQLILSDLVESVPGMHQVLGLYRSYPHISALDNFELAQQEVSRASRFLEQDNYKEALAELDIAYYDMESSIKLLDAPLSDVEAYPDITAWTDVFSIEPEVRTLSEIFDKIPTAISTVEQEQVYLKSIRDLIEKGNYTGALDELEKANKRIVKSRIVVQNAIGLITTQTMTYPDIVTSLDFFQSAQNILDGMQEGIENGVYDEEDILLALRKAEHDMNTSNTILSRNVWEAEHGLSLKDTRTYKLSLKKYRATLEDAREEYMKTEILAPFDGTVVEIGVSEDDQLSSQDYSSTTAVKIVDTGMVQFEGVVDEVDIFAVEVDQKAIIVIDAMPDEEFTGTVTFISPSGTTETGVVNYAVTVVLDPTDVKLRGSLTATADIVQEDKKDVLLLPARAMIETPEGVFVDLWDEVTMETQRRQIVTGTRTYQFVEVVSGLDEGDKVVVGQ
jgi:RND family efflux transporter MFP subunit